MKVDFIVLENATRLPALRELCELLWQSYQAKESVYVHVNSPEEVEFMDKLMWTYRDDSFLPHSADRDEAAPIHIGCEAPLASHTLVNLTQQVPAFIQQFERVIELVYQDAAVQTAARERFKQYRDAGHTLNTTKMKVSFT